jgi:hypothetical protein
MTGEETRMNDPTIPAGLMQEFKDGSAAAAPIYLNLVVSDAETSEALLEHEEGRPRTQFALTALKVGVLALRAARGTIDTAAVRSESERLLALLGERLEKHRDLVDSVIGRTLANYFDPRSGQFNDRVARLVAEDGELAAVIQRKVVDASRGIDEILAAHLGENSPLLALLAPGEGNQLVASIRASIDNTVRAQSEALLSQFSLDNESGALRRLLGELTTKHGDLQKALAEQVEAVVDEFSLDKEDSALSRLVSQVQRAQQQIASEFSLDNESSGLSRLAHVVNQHYETQRVQAQGFQDKVLAILERIDTRRAEQARTTTHGRIFEETVGDAVLGLVQPAGDLFEAVSNTTGNIPRSKTGDFVVTLSDDSAAPGARIVFEAKEDASYRLADTVKEADAARENRGAGVCVFVHSKKTAPADIGPFARYGQNLVIVWDAEDEATDVVLTAAVACAKAISVRTARRSSAETASMQKIDEAIAAINKQIEGFDEIQASANSVMSAARRIENRARIMSEQIARHTEALVEQVVSLKAPDEQ